MLFKRLFLTVILLAALHCMQAQENVHPQSEKYEWPADPQVKAKLEQWQDIKFGMIVHWGLYAVPGIVESWMLCSEDWIDRPAQFTYDEFKKWYWGLKDEFNPVNFNPDQWAKAGKAAGMKYLVFTTKHHDGFSMFDTKQSDFKITAGPFANNPKADVTKYIFEAFRNQGFMIGAYFSKPDWHTEYYWWPKYATADRNNNYDIKKYPSRWQQFKDFTHNQIGELMRNYGKVDILWLDGGWVRPRETVNAEVLSWGARIPEWSQDIEMPKIAAMARQAQPGILVVDRTVHGEFENYQTPEQRVPKEKLDHPWESCMTLGNGWGWIQNERYKTSARIIHTLAEIVAKGGNLLLGIGPKADGTLPDEVVQRLEEIGKWMNVNGKAIYETRTTENYRDGNTFFTSNKKGDTLHAIVCLPEGEAIPASVEWKDNIPAKGSKMIFLHTGKTVKYTVTGNTVKVVLPGAFLKQVTAYPALAFSFNKTPVHDTGKN
jgi:alpha-L-fucosidase